MIKITEQQKNFEEFYLLSGYVTSKFPYKLLDYIYCCMYKEQKYIIATDVKRLAFIKTTQEEFKPDHSYKVTKRTKKEIILQEHSNTFTGAQFPDWIAILFDYKNQIQLNTKNYHIALYQIISTIQQPINIDWIKELKPLKKGIMKYGTIDSKSPIIQIEFDNITIIMAPMEKPEEVEKIKEYCLDP